MSAVGGSIPLLPVNAPNVSSLRTAEDSNDKRPLIENLKAKYEVADKRLYALEEELDCLLYCSQKLREQRLQLLQGRITYADSLPNERSMPSADVNQLVDQYLILVRKEKDIDDVVEKVKSDCKLARTQCCSLFAKTRGPSERHSGPNGAGSCKEAETMLGQERTFLSELMRQDMWGSMDSSFFTQRFMEMRTRIREIGAVVGVLGTGATFSTLLSANRGRLDLVSWSFVAFVLLLLHSVLHQALECPKSFHTFTLEHSSLASRRNQSILHDAPSLVLMILGTIFVILSIATCDPSGPPVPGSKIALRVTVCIPLLAIGYTVVVAVKYIAGSERKLPQTTNSRPHVPSHLVPRDKRWRLLPGGDEYTIYRKQRAKGASHLIL